MTTESSRENLVNFEILYSASYKDIYSYVYRRLPYSTSDVADIVSDVFTTAWRRIGDLPAAPQDRPWLFGVARLRLLEHQRSHFHLQRLFSRLEAEPSRVNPSDFAADPRYLRIRMALKELRQMDREVLTLVYWDGLSHHEVASVLGCSVNAVALRVKKAKVRLQDKLTSGSSTVDLATKISPLPITQKEQLP
jgi:RNA polymerase sigma factor (sigma-70 family)